MIALRRCLISLGLSQSLLSPTSAFTSTFSRNHAQLPAAALTSKRIQSLSFDTLLTVRGKIASIDENESKDHLFEPIGVGVKRDFSRRLPFYKSDIVDGLNAQTLACTLFLFFACLAPAVGFGSVAQLTTGGQMGVLEMCASTALCGVVYALAAAQPMQISTSLLL